MFLIYCSDNVTHPRRTCHEIRCGAFRIAIAGGPAWNFIYFELSPLPRPITTCMPSKKNLTVAVIGPAGMTGSYTVVELLNRGHSVVGISRNPTAIGKHDRYKAIPIDFDNSSISEIAKSFEGVDALVKYPSPVMVLLILVRMDLIRAERGRYSTCLLWKRLGKLFLRRNVQKCHSLLWLVDVGVCISLDRKMTRHAIHDNGGFSTVEESPIRKPTFNTWKNGWDI
jgi:hypothetical protein